jgi:hypothetical protein
VEDFELKIVVLLTSAALILTGCTDGIPEYRKEIFSDSLSHPHLAR